MRPPHVRGLRALWLAIAAMCLPGGILLANSGGTPTLSYENEPVVISGDTNTEGGLTGHVVITALTDAEAWLVAGDLTRVADDPDGVAPTATSAPCRDSGCIDASRLTIEPAVLQLKAGVATSVKLTVTGIDRAGLYVGDIGVQVRSAPREPSPMAPATPSPTEPLEPGSPIQVVVRAHEAIDLPSLPKTEVVTARRTHLEGWLDYLLSAIVLPDVDRERTVVVPFINPGTDTLTVTQRQVVAIGQQSGLLLTEPLAMVRLSEGLNDRIPPTVRTPFFIELSLDRIRRDRYLGGVYITAADRDLPFVVPLDLTIRNGPAGPFALIFLGLALGYSTKWLTGTGARQTEAAAAVGEIESRVESAAITPGDRSALAPQIALARRDLDGGALARATASVTLLNAALDLLEELRRFEVRHPKADEEAIRGVRDMAYILNVPLAREALNALVKASTPERPQSAGGPPGGPPPNLAVRTRRTNRLVLLVGILFTVVAFVGVSVLQEAAGPPVPTPTPVATAAPIGPPLAERTPSYQLRGAIWVLGLITLGAVAAGSALAVRRFPRTRFRMIRFATWSLDIATLLLLLFVGLKIVYADEAAASVATVIDPVYQYLLWGLAGGLGGKALTSLVK